jgi:hypothetical protein
MTTTNDGLYDLEELRAIFVLGVIGSLLTVEHILGAAQITSNISFRTVTLYLIIYWGLYVFLMAIGVSDDIVNPRITHACVKYAIVFFILGIAATLAVPAAILFDYFVTIPFKLPSTIDAVIPLAIATLIFPKMKHPLLSLTR